MSPHRRKQLLRLFERQDGRCHWCGCDMLPPGSHQSRRGVPTPPTLCTYDHGDDHWSGERGQHQGEKRNVAACFKCNNERSNARQAAQPKSVLQLRAGKFPGFSPAWYAGA